MSKNPKSKIQNPESLEHRLSEPTDACVAALRDLSGDVILLGVGGKMGPTLARMAQRASELAGVSRRILGVSRFSDAQARRALEAHGIETISGDLLDTAFVDTLPDSDNVIFMTGMKFGAGHDPSRTWAMNTYVPSLICRRYRDGKLLAFSTGNVYGPVRPDHGGSLETDELRPVGEYAMSALGRERIVEYFSRLHEIPATIVRLNYSCELRYGVLVDLAQLVRDEQPIDLSMGYVNVIWQRDANAMALCALADAQSPPLVINVAGSECLSVRDVCERFGVLLGKQPRFVGTEAPNALLSNARMAYARYGEPSVDAYQMIQWIADWLDGGGSTLGKPTHFQARDGRF